MGMLNPPVTSMIFQNIRDFPATDDYIGWPKHRIFGGDTWKNQQWGPTMLPPSNLQNELWHKKASLFVFRGWTRSWAAIKGWDVLLCMTETPLSIIFSNIFTQSISQHSTVSLKIGCFHQMIACLLVTLPNWTGDWTEPCLPMTTHVLPVIESPLYNLISYHVIQIKTKYNIM